MITSWTNGNAADNMAEDILVDLAGTIARHPWWKNRGKLTLELLRRLGVRPPASVLEAGCGWGTNLIMLEEAGYQAAGLDISHQCLEMLDRPGRTLFEADLTQALPQNSPEYDAVLSLDVLEHV